MDAGSRYTGTNVYFLCRISASKYNDNLKSRERAAEYFGISVSALANYERGIKDPPKDIVLMMADTYNAPELINRYCINICPFGQKRQLSEKVKTLEAVTVGIVAKLNGDKIEKIKRKLLEIAEDGIISEDEEQEFLEITEELDKLAVSISELRLVKERRR